VRQGTMVMMMGTMRSGAVQLLYVKGITVSLLVRRFFCSQGFRLYEYSTRRSLQCVRSKYDTRAKPVRRDKKRVSRLSVAPNESSHMEYDPFVRPPYHLEKSSSPEMTTHLDQKRHAGRLSVIRLISNSHLCQE
jgi:hypothetical protein